MAKFCTFWTSAKLGEGYGWDFSGKNQVQPTTERVHLMVDANGRAKRRSTKSLLVNLTTFWHSLPMWGGLKRQQSSCTSISMATLTCFCELTIGSGRWQPWQRPWQSYYRSIQYKLCSDNKSTKECRPLPRRMQSRSGVEIESRNPVDFQNSMKLPCPKIHLWRNFQLDLTTLSRHCKANCGKMPYLGMLKNPPKIPRSGRG